MSEQYRSSPRLHTHETCETMNDVRYEVDRLDKLLVEVLAERVSYMRAAARIKPSRDKVYDRDRIEDVVAKVLNTASQHGLPPQIAEPLWRTLIDGCIDYEYTIFDELKGSDVDS